MFVERKKCISSASLSLLCVCLLDSCWIVQHTRAILFVFFSRRHESIFTLFRRKDVHVFRNYGYQKIVVTHLFWSESTEVQFLGIIFQALTQEWVGQTFHQDTFLFDACYTFVFAINALLNNVPWPWPEWKPKTVWVGSGLVHRSLNVVAEGVALADIKGETLLNQVKITQFEGISGGRWEAVYAVAASMVSNDVTFFIHSPLLSISLSAKKQIHIWLALVQLGKISLYLKRGRQLEISYPSSSQAFATSRLPVLPSTTAG